MMQHGEAVKNNIRLNPDLEPLGAVGDLAWYCVRFILFAFNYELPEAVSFARVHKTHNSLPMDLSAEIQFKDGKSASLHVSFYTAFSQWAHCLGEKGSVYVRDFVIPEEAEKAWFMVNSKYDFTDLMRKIIRHDERIEHPIQQQEFVLINRISKIVIDQKEGNSRFTADDWNNLEIKTKTCSINNGIPACCNTDNSDASSNNTICTCYKGELRPCDYAKLAFATQLICDGIIQSAATSSPTTLQWDKWNKAMCS